MAEVACPVIDFRRHPYQNGKKIKKNLSLELFKADSSQKPDRNNFLPFQEWIRDRYESDPVQIFVAFLIFFNFFVAALNAQLRPQPTSPMGNMFHYFEYVFAIVFTVELVFNFYGHWFWEFWKSGWNWFDFVIVVISLTSLLGTASAGFTFLRLFRAFRVVRLFNRVGTLKGIVMGVLASLGGVGNAFLILAIIMGIWSIMGVEFFGENQQEEFGTFIRAMFTMIQVMSMDSWASIIARGTIYEHNMWAASIYYISYLFIAGIVMTNVVVAILLEKYLAALEEIKAENEKIQNNESSENYLMIELKQLSNNDMKLLLIDLLTPSRIKKLTPKLLVKILETHACKENLYKTVALHRKKGSRKYRPGP